MVIRPCEDRPVLTAGDGRGARFLCLLLSLLMSANKSDISMMMCRRFAISECICFDPYKVSSLCPSATLSTIVVESDTLFLRAIFFIIRVAVEHRTLKNAAESCKDRAVWSSEHAATAEVASFFATHPRRALKK